MLTLLAIDQLGSQNYYHHILRKAPEAKPQPIRFSKNDAVS
jgi:hypothetical protein